MAAVFLLSSYALLKKLVVIYLACFVTANLLCYIDYETVSLARAWKNSESRQEIFLLAAMLAVVYLVVGVSLTKLIAIYYNHR
ncbi:hypothetical protein CLV84_0099 [Neolewinella xylanilytica]|uniref:Uncharacterized protein n=1 Tax=Neolewinella xylanilytica TaxID=1514080 RepID=A0A2S6I6R1_9BACT|nr:hypothetical protein [Neolewinella xylanilytica]PPK87165.1 hypothetical protein CLV84_0099 [Neolewinella xylanilytica]